MKQLPSAAVLAVMLIIALLALSAHALEMPAPVPIGSSPASDKFSLKMVASSNLPGRIEPNSKLCPTCVQVMSQGISTLLNVILNGGVIGTCSKLCSHLDKYGQLPVVGCNLACSVVGVKVFVDLVKKADLNPIWLCQQVRMCPIHDCELPECARFGSTVTQPPEGRKGTTFEVTTEFEVFERTGTGQFIFQVIPVGVEPMGLSQLVPDGFQEGVYSVKVNVPIRDQRGGENPIIFLPGVYHGAVAICQGLCGSKRPHTRLLAQTRFNFTVTP